MDDRVSIAGRCKMMMMMTDHSIAGRCKMMMMMMIDYSIAGRCKMIMMMIMIDYSIAGRCKMIMMMIMLMLIHFYFSFVFVVPVLNEATCHEDEWWVVYV
jgi:hypothetical protein